MFRVSSLEEHEVKTADNSETRQYRVRIPRNSEQGGSEALCAGVFVDVPSYAYILLFLQSAHRLASRLPATD